ncbi:MAG: hypothetical protein WCN88_02055 [Candidatus Falkowbacteria bacterium]
MQIILIVGIIVAVALFIFWPAFRTFVLNLLANLFAIAADFVRRYSIAVLVVLILIAILVITGLFIPSAIYKGIAFGLAAGLVYLIWLPAGIILRIFRVTEETFPESVRAIAAWFCFVGFVGIVFPDFTSKPIVALGAILLFGFYAGLSSKFDFLNRIAPIIVLLMLAWVGWKYVAPDSYRATTRFMTAHADNFFAKTDRNSIITEADAKATYGYLLKDIEVAYKVTLRNDTISEISDLPVLLKKDSLFLVVNHKRKNYLYDGQSFIEIKLPNRNGSYVTGKKIWVEADLIEIGARNNIDKSLEIAADESEDSGFATTLPPILEEGTLSVLLQPGEKTSWFGFQDGKKYNYKISSPKNDFIVYFSDGSEPFEGGPDKVIPMKRHCYYSLKALSKQVVTITTNYL